MSTLHDTHAFSPLLSPLFLAVVLLGSALELFWGRAWRSTGQRICSFSCFLASLGVTVSGAAVGIPLFASALAAVALYEGAKRSVICLEDRTGNVLAARGTLLWLSVPGIGRITASRLGTDRRIRDGDSVSVQIKFSRTFGWILGANVR